jgi:hypothetical protein
MGSEDSWYNPDFEEQQREQKITQEIESSFST